MACMILIMGIIACFFGIMKMQGKLQSARKQAEQAKGAAETAKGDRVRANTALNFARETNKDDMAFYEVWQPEFLKIGNDSELNDLLQASIRAGNMVALEVGSVEVGTPKDPYIPKIIRLTYGIESTFPKLFNWLADTEALHRVARVSNLSVTKASGESDIKMNVSFDFPQVAAEPEPGKPAAPAPKGKGTVAKK